MAVVLVVVVNVVVFENGANGFKTSSLPEVRVWEGTQGLGSSSQQGPVPLDCVARMAEVWASHLAPPPFGVFIRPTVSWEGGGATVRCSVGRPASHSVVVA